MIILVRIVLVFFVIMGVASYKRQLPPPTPADFEAYVQEQSIKNDCETMNWKRKNAGQSLLNCDFPIRVRDPWAQPSQWPLWAGGISFVLLLVSLVPGVLGRRGRM